MPTATLVTVLTSAGAPPRIEVEPPGLDPAAPLHLCSAAKALTAVGVLRLAGRGVLDLDADLREWVPVPGRWGPTLRQLLTHRGGVADPPGSFEPGPVPPVAELVAGRTPAHPGPITPSVEPGTAVAYSDAGYCLVERAVEVATGEAFATVMHRELAAPLGLTRTGFWAGEDSPVAAGAALGNAGRGPRRHYPGLAASGLWSAATEIAVWLADLGRSLAGQDGVLLTADQAAQWVADPGGSGVAAGVFPFGAPGRPCVMTQGWGVGFQCQLRWYPAAGGAVAMVLDADPGAPQAESVVGRTMLRRVTGLGWR